MSEGSSFSLAVRLLSHRITAVYLTSRELLRPVEFTFEAAREELNEADLESLLLVITREQDG